MQAEHFKILKSWGIFEAEIAEESLEEDPQRRQEHQPMYFAEQECLQTDHSIVGKLLAMRWRLATQLIRMIGGHHSPRMNHYALESSLMRVADVLAHIFGHEVNLVNEVPPLQLKAWKETGLAEEALIPVIQRVDSEFKGIVAIFFS